KDHLQSALSLRSLVFPRQLIYVVHGVKNLPESDKVTPLVAPLQEDTPLNPQKLYSQLFVEAPDTNEGKQLQKFCRKVAQPLANRLKRSGYKRVYSRADCPQVHVFFPDYEQAWVGFSYPPDASSHEMGIIRLKFPHDAPSRSTLKLEEAFFYF